jgi:hypothetical protein
MSPLLPITNTPYKPEGMFAEDFDKAFDFFAKAKNNDDIIQDEEFEQRIFEKLEDYRKDPAKPRMGYNRWYYGVVSNPARKQAKSINFVEFQVLRREFGLPFANNALGYFLKNNVEEGNKCGITYRSAANDDLDSISKEISIKDYVIKLKEQIRIYSREDISKGVSKKALKDYWDGRNAKGLEDPILTRYRNELWSQPYDVGAEEWPKDMNCIHASPIVRISQQAN